MTQTGKKTYRKRQTLKQLVQPRWVQGGLNISQNMFLLSLEKKHYIDFTLDDAEWIMAHDNLMQQPGSVLEPLEKTFVFVSMVSEMLDCDPVEIVGLSKERRQEIIKNLIMENVSIWESVEESDLNQADYGITGLLTEHYFQEEDAAEGNGSYHVRLTFMRVPTPDGQIGYTLQAVTEDYFIRKQIPDYQRRFMKDNKRYVLESGFEDSYLAEAFQYIMDRREDLSRSMEEMTTVDVDKLLAEVENELD